MALTTVLFYDYFLTLQDEVRVYFPQRISMLTLSSCNTRGKEKSHGVRCLGYELSIHFVEPGQAFAIFFLVRILDPLGLP